ncbi:MAG: hypothetical protein HYY90_01140, partial [Candidatus Omnitrophica bacterium]|nr:hypothetical protein [Candidatus Omnitrophota bacterium]
PGGTAEPPAEPTPLAADAEKSDNGSPGMLALAVLAPPFALAYAGVAVPMSIVLATLIVPLVWVMWPGSWTLAVKDLWRWLAGLIRVPMGKEAAGPTGGRALSDSRVRSAGGLLPLKVIAAGTIGVSVLGVLVSLAIGTSLLGGVLLGGLVGGLAAVVAVQFIRAPEGPVTEGRASSGTGPRTAGQQRPRSDQALGRLALRTASSSSKATVANRSQIVAMYFLRPLLSISPTLARFLDPVNRAMPPPAAAPPMGGGRHSGDVRRMLSVAGLMTVGAFLGLQKAATGFDGQPRSAAGDWLDWIVSFGPDALLAGAVLAALGVPVLVWLIMRSRRTRARSSKKYLSSAATPPVMDPNGINISQLAAEALADTRQARKGIEDAFREEATKGPSRILDHPLYKKGAAADLAAPAFKLVRAEFERLYTEALRGKGVDEADIADQVKAVADRLYHSAAAIRAMGERPHAPASPDQRPHRQRRTPRRTDDVSQQLPIWILSVLQTSLIFGALAASGQPEVTRAGLAFLHPWIVVGLAPVLVALGLALGRVGEGRQQEGQPSEPDVSLQFLEYIVQKLADQPKMDWSAFDLLVAAGELGISREKSQTLIGAFQNHPDLPTVFIAAHPTSSKGDVVVIYNKKLIIERLGRMTPAAIDANFHDPKVPDLSEKSSGQERYERLIKAGYAHEELLLGMMGGGLAAIPKDELIATLSSARAGVVRADDINRFGMDQAALEVALSELNEDTTNPRWFVSQSDGSILVQFPDAARLRALTQQFVDESQADILRIDLRFASFTDAVRSGDRVTLKTKAGELDNAIQRLIDRLKVWELQVTPVHTKEAKDKWLLVWNLLHYLVNDSLHSLNGYAGIVADGLEKGTLSEEQIQEFIAEMDDAFGAIQSILTALSMMPEVTFLSDPGSTNLIDLDAIMPRVKELAIREAAGELAAALKPHVAVIRDAMTVLRAEGPRLVAELPAGQDYAARVAAVRARLIALRDRVSAVPSTVSSIMELLGHHHHLSAARTDARGFGMQAILRTVRKGDPLQAYDIVNALGAIQINTGLIGESLETLIMALQAGKILSERRTEPSVPFATEQRVLEPEVADQAEPLEKALRGHLNKVTYLFGMVSDPKVPVDPETFNVALEDAQRRLAAVRDAIEGIAQAPESGALLRDTMKHLSTAFQSLEFYAKLGLENRKRFEKFVDRMSQPLAEAATIVAGLKELAHRARAGKPVPVAIWEMRDGKRFAHVDLKQLWGEAVAERVNRSASAMERIERVLSDLKELPGSSAPLRVAEVEERAYVDLRNWTAHPPTNALEERAKAFFYARAPHEDVAARVAEPAADQEGGQALGMVGWLAWAIPTLRRLWLPGPVIAAWGAVSELFFAGGINVLLSFVPWVAATLGFPDALGADSLALRLSLVLLSSFLYASPWKIGHPTLVTYRKGRVVTEEGTVGVVIRTILFALGVVFRLGYLRPDLLSPAGALGVALVLHAFHNAVVAPLLAFSAPWLRWPLGMAGETKAGPQAGPVDAVARMFQSLEKEPLHGTRFTERRYARNVTQDPDTGTWTVEFQIAPPGWMPSIVAKLSSSVSPTVGSVQFRYDPAWPALTIQQARIEQESQGDGLYSATVTRVMSALPPLTRLRFVIDERNTIETLYDALPRNVLQSMPDEFELFYLKDEQRIYPAARELAVPGIREADLHLVTTNDGHVWVEALSGWDRFWSEQPETGDDVRRALEGFVNTYQSELHMAPPREVIREIGDMLRAGIAQRVMGEEQEKERHEESDPFHVFLQTLKGVPPTDLNDIAFLRAT